ncbi:peptidoglycan-binding protein [Streptomyces sp. NPDC020379]|uniref:peptidoglycan recognition protein family protein n=1 Tax=Streptomyces sp. NPDC020379 TaxID=3365071 RepID=UPI00379B258E
MRTSPRPRIKTPTSPRPRPSTAGPFRYPNKETALPATTYPKADNDSQWFSGRYPGDTMPHPNVIVLHTTECSSWPDYDDGAVAPTFTVKGGQVRQHFDANESARALVNAPGGVQTNTLNAVQIELVGTCEKGGPGLYWPEASDEDMAGLVGLVRWLTSEYPIPLVSTSKPWRSYPSSYGSSGGQRMSFTEWTNFEGICGHQHVPENDHGDPGAFPIQRLIALVKGEKPTPPKPSSTIVPLASGVEPGKRHSQVRDLQRLLITAGYGPIKGAVTDYYGANTQAAVAAFHDANPELKSTGTARDVAIGERGFEELQKEAGRR